MIYGILDEMGEGEVKDLSKIEVHQLLIGSTVLIKYLTITTSVLYT